VDDIEKNPTDMAIWNAKHAIRKIWHFKGYRQAIAE
jgi:hypothetical protein